MGRCSVAEGRQIGDMEDLQSVIVRLLAVTSLFSPQKKWFRGMVVGRCSVAEGRQIGDMEDLQSVIVSISCCDLSVFTPTKQAYIERLQPRMSQNPSCITPKLLPGVWTQHALLHSLAHKMINKRGFCVISIIGLGNWQIRANVKVEMPRKFVGKKWQNLPLTHDYQRPNGDIILLEKCGSTPAPSLDTDTCLSLEVQVTH